MREPGGIPNQYYCAKVDATLIKRDSLASPSVSVDFS